MRARIWIFTLLVVGAAAAAAIRLSLDLRAAALADIDALLAGAAAQVASSARNLAREASAAAAFTARDEKLVAALNAREGPAVGRRGRAAPAAQPDEAMEEKTLAQAARSALTSVEGAVGFELPGTTVVTAGNREWVARKGPPSVAEGDAMTYLRGAIDGKVRRGWVRFSGKLFYGAATPAGPGAGLMVLVPLDEAWARELAASAGVDVTLSAPDVKEVSTVAALDSLAVASAARKPGASSDVGRFDGAAVSVGPLKLPQLPLLFGGAPASRARAFPLDGVQNGFVVVSAPTRPALAGIVRFEWIALVALALTFLVGFVLGATARSFDA